MSKRPLSPRSSDNSTDASPPNAKEQRLDQDQPVLPPSNHEARQALVDQLRQEASNIATGEEARIQARGFLLSQYLVEAHQNSVGNLLAHVVVPPALVEALPALVGFLAACFAHYTPSLPGAIRTIFEEAEHATPELVQQWTPADEPRARAAAARSSAPLRCRASHRPCA